MGEIFSYNTNPPLLKDLSLVALKIIKQLIIESRIEMLKFGQNGYGIDYQNMRYPTFGHADFNNLTYVIYNGIFSSYHGLNVQIQNTAITISTKIKETLKEGDCYNFDSIVRKISGLLNIKINRIELKQINPIEITEKLFKNNTFLAFYGSKSQKYLTILPIENPTEKQFVAFLDPTKYGVIGIFSLDEFLDLIVNSELNDDFCMYHVGKEID